MHAGYMILVVVRRIWGISIDFGGFQKKITTGAIGKATRLALQPSAVGKQRSQLYGNRRECRITGNPSVVREFVGTNLFCFKKKYILLNDRRSCSWVTPLDLTLGRFCDGVWMTGKLLHTLVYYTYFSSVALNEWIRKKTSLNMRYHDDRSTHQLDRDHDHDALDLNGKRACRGNHSNMHIKCARMYRLQRTEFAHTHVLMILPW